MRREHIFRHTSFDPRVEQNEMSSQEHEVFSERGGWPKPLKMRTILQLNFIRNELEALQVWRLFMSRAYLRVALIECNTEMFFSYSTVYFLSVLIIYKH